MSKEISGSCPNPKEFVKWWRSRASRNADALSDAGKALRADNYTVSEEQVNSRFKLLPSSFEPGTVLAKLHACAIACYDMKPGEYHLGWSPKEFDKIRETLVESEKQP